MRKNTSNFYKNTVAALFVCFALAGINQSNAQNLLSESFDGVTFVPVGWTNLVITSGNTWTRVTTGNQPAQTPHSGAGEAKFNSNNGNGIIAIITPALNFTVAGTKTVSFWMYRDNWEGSTNADLIDVLVNITSSNTGATLIGTVYRRFSSPPVVTLNGWYHYSFTVPGSFTTATNYILFRGTGTYGNNIYIDDVSIDNAPDCAGTPNAGILTSPLNVCPGETSSIIPTGLTAGSGITYQWQSAATCSGPWTDIAGQTMATLTGSQTLATSYHIVTTCANSGLTNTSNCLTVGLNGLTECYCTYYNTSAINYYVKSFSTTGGTTNITNNNTGLSTNGYGNYTAMTVSQLPGSAVNFSITGAGGVYQNKFAIWVDWNQDGAFSTGEKVYNNTNLGSNASGSITVPAGTNPGSTRMRVMAALNLPSNDPCGTFVDGEIEDYTFIILASPCSGTPLAGTISGPVSVCSGVGFNLTSSGLTSGSGISYQWQSAASCAGSWTDISGETNPTLSASITTATSYRLQTTCSNGGASNTSNCITVDVISIIQPGAIIGSTDVCSGSGQLYSISPVNGATSYIWIVPNGWNILNGQGTTSITVATNNASGDVTVAAINACGTSAATALTVTINPLPSVNLGADTVICSNQTITLNAGAGFSSYLWTGGSTAQTLVVDGATTGIGMFSYHVNVSNSFNCFSADTISVTVTSCTGIDAMANEPTINYCPNPAKDAIAIEINSFAGETILCIYNLQGQLLIKQNMVQAKTVTNISGLAKGVYIIKVSNANGVGVMKLVKE